jgi:hypothetical protein
VTRESIFISSEFTEEIRSKLPFMIFPQKELDGFNLPYLGIDHIVVPTDTDVRARVSVLQLAESPYHYLAFSCVL